MVHVRKYTSPMDHRGIHTRFVPEVYLITLHLSDVEKNLNAFSFPRDPITF